MSLPPTLKGVSAASLDALAPVSPVNEMDREDCRFIDAREVGSGFDASTNLASISRTIRERIFQPRWRSEGHPVL